eukprot:6852514-Lingulodinium_polyedra.AAC.1
MNPCAARPPRSMPTTVGGNSCPAPATKRWHARARPSPPVTTHSAPAPLFSSLRTNNSGVETATNVANPATASGTLRRS